MTEVLKKFFSVKDVAAQLDMSAHFIYREISRGALKHYALGGSARKKGRIRISGEQIQSYLDDQINQRKNCVVNLVTAEVNRYTMDQHDVSHRLNRLLKSKGKRKATA